MSMVHNADCLAARAASRCAVGSLRLTTIDPSRGRPVLLDVWYPSVPARTPVGAPVDGWPAVLLSHGAFGAASNYTWLGTGLAARGIVVVGVSHYGESFAYGAASIEMAAVTRPWERALDVSWALDHVLGDRVAGVPIDPRRIGAIGHSSGGATVLELGGAVFDPAGMRRYCGAVAADSDRGCDYARLATTSRPDPKAEASYLDERIRAIVALDPALGPGHTAASLAAFTAPIHVIGAVDNDFLPFDAHAARYWAEIPGAQLTRLTGGEGHFVFLDAGDGDRSANGVALYRDRPTVDRRRVHRRLGDIVVGFFEEHLAL